MSCKTALGKEKLVCSGKILKDTLHLIILKMLQKRKWQEIRKGEIGDGIEKLSGLSVGLFVGSIGLSFWLFVGDIFAYLSETLAKKVGAFVPSTEVADPRAANRETGYKVCFWFHTKELRLRREEKACFLGKTGNMGCYRTRIRSCLTYQLSKAFQKLLILLLTLKPDVQESVGDSFVTNRSLAVSLKQYLNSFRTDRQLSS